MFLALYANAQVSITLRKTFIDSVKDKVTLSSNCEVYFAAAHPHPGSEDGDMHFSGYDAKVGFPLVAEIMNGKDVPDAMDLAKNAQGNGKPHTKLKLQGVWRLWCEHANNLDNFKQGPLAINISNTNPPHVFEIHPITAIGDIPVARLTLHPIGDYTLKDAEAAFSHYANLPCRIKSTVKTITIVTKEIGYNYVDFWIKLADAHPKTVADGLFAYCSVYSARPGTEEEEGDEKLIDSKVRMVFPKDTDPFDAVGRLQTGEFLHVIGIPRVDLAVISWRAAHAATHPELLSWNLPIEMIVVGVIR